MVRPLAFLRTVPAHAVRAIVRRDVFGILGGAMIAEGAREIAQPAGFIVAGGLILTAVILHARGESRLEAPPAGATE